VFVTGATGFLGSHLAGMLVRAGADVAVLVRDESAPTSIARAWLAEVTKVRGDVRDQALLERAIGEHGARSVFHLAAQTQAAAANRNPVSSFESNVRGTWALLEATRRSPLVEQVVVASSDKAYGSQPELPYTEATPLLAVHPYDVSKACADMVASSYHEVFDVPVCITRCGNFYGPGDLNWDRVVPGCARAALRGKAPVLRSDGTPVRDYLYVEDGALAYITLAEALAARPELAGEAFNFSAERQMTVLELTRMICEAAGRPDLEPDIRGTATHEIGVQQLSAAKARHLLGWSARFPVEEALQRTICWYKEHLLGPAP